MRFPIAFVATAVCITLASAEEHVVVQSSLTFNPSSITVRPGDTIRWERTTGTHDVVQGLPCFESTDPIFEAMDLTASNPIAQWVVPNAVYGEIPYFCSVATHCQQGMTGMIFVEPPEGATIHEVAQIGVTFVPENIVVAPGDVVRWTWNGGGHTASSGDTVTCTEDNKYFNLLLDDQHTEAFWVVSEDMPEILPYLCIWHCEQDHVGKLIKKEEDCVGDLDGNGRVDGADLTILLGAWGTSNPIADLTGDGLVNGADLTVLLGNWGDC